MKRFLMILLALITVLSFVACGGENGKPESNVESVDESSKAEGEASSTDSEISSDEPEKYAPLVLLEEGKVEEAYKLLIADKDNEQAKELLSKINVVFTNQTVKDNLFNEYSFEYEYDENGKVLSVTLVYKDGTKVKYIYEYDENGNMTKGYEGLLSISHTEIYYIYDLENRIAQTTKRLYGTDIVQTTVYEYNSEGLIVKAIVSGNVDSEFVAEYEYDENGNVKKLVKKYTDGVETQVEYFYDRYGRLTELKENIDDTVYVEKITYNRDGLTTNITEYDNNGLEYIISDYYYDDIGNPDKMIQIYVDGYRVTTRFFGYEYFYYPNGIPDSAKQNINEQ